MDKFFVLNFCVENEWKGHVAWKEGENVLKIKEKKQLQKEKSKDQKFFFERWIFHDYFYIES